MPRNKAVTKKRAGGSSGGGRGPKKIVIRPFQKPPTLPPNYYEQTSRELLEGTVDVAFGGTTITADGQKQQNLSLQNSYQQVVNLVSHKYGPRLYRDLVATLQKACEEHALPTATLELKSSAEANPDVLGYIQSQYQKYVDYLLLCKHVFLPLDRTHAWLPSTGEVLKRSSSSSGGETTSTCTNSSASPIHQSSNNIDGSKKMTLMDLWQVGLLQFRRRLQDFQWDDLIYQKWWESLQMDWDDTLAG